MAPRRLTSRAASSLLTLLATGVLLGGCMNDDDSSPNAGAAPSNVTPSTSTSSYLAGVRNTTTGPDGEGNFSASAVLSLVDDVTATEVTTTPIDAYTEPKMAQAFTMSADGKSQVAGRQTRAYYVYQHKLYEISLEHDSTVLSKPVAKQISTESQACEIRQVVEADGSAQANYLSYTAAGDDGNCATLEDNKVKSALSSTGEAQPVAHIALQRNGSGQAVRALGLNTLHKLVVVDTTGTTTEVVNGDVGASTTVSAFGPVAGTRDKVYIMVGNQVRTLDWITGTLDTTVLATLAQPQTALLHTDDNATYFTDITTNLASGLIDLVLWRIKPGLSAAERVATLASTTDTAAEVVSHAMTPNTLAVVVRKNGSDSLTVIKKSDASARNVSLSGAGALGIQAQAGEVLIVSQQASAGDSTVALSRLDLGNSDSLSLLSSAASLVTVIRDTSTTMGGEIASNYLLWSDSNAVHSHKLGSNTSLSIADTSTLTGWNGGALSASVANLTVGLLRGVTTSTPNSQTLWLFDAAKAVAAK